MLNLKNFDGEIYLNGERVDGNVDLGNIKGVTTIKLVPMSFVKKSMQNNVPSIQNNISVDGKKTYKFTVKPYMTRKASPEFDFMAKFNNDNPMPLRTMIGWIEKETKGMVYVHLKGFAQETITCLRCGRELTNPISRKYGIGPECIQKIGIFLDIQDVDGIKEKLVETEWTGWIIRSSILAQEEI